ncbi:hypothetical protein CDAR_381031 [Caerostris darwini]|uniref:Uncharacterized protein n=1 Tax=Caerostris darwini TaxID=1538125 RepID=A0AAV4USU2_9ARAC|nr:hypothetical protein CDAR_381031 [Caerostris darwini]
MCFKAVLAGSLECSSNLKQNKYFKMVWNRAETVNRFLNAVDNLHWSYLVNSAFPLSMCGCSLSSFKNERKNVR